MFGVEGLIFNLFITVCLVSVLLFIFNFIAEALGGASFNPTLFAAFSAAGIHKESLFSVSIRLPAQAAGAAGGALAINELMPVQYKHMLGGPSLKVDMHSGAIAEGVLTFAVTFLALFIILRGPKSSLLKNWLLAASTVMLVVAGSGYTGPSMNPVNAFGWAYVNNRHNTWEHLYVYWISPFVGTILSASLYGLIFPPPVKQKRA
ncbi:hypothetical protein ACET3Z_024246 [Daucus carota]